MPCVFLLPWHCSSCFFSGVALARVKQDELEIFLHPLEVPRSPLRPLTSPLLRALDQESRIKNQVCGVRLRPVLKSMQPITPSTAIYPCSSFQGSSEVATAPGGGIGRAKGTTRPTQKGEFTHVQTGSTGPGRSSKLQLATKLQAKPSGCCSTAPCQGNMLPSNAAPGSQHKPHSKHTLSFVLKDILVNVFVNLFIPFQHMIYKYLTASWQFGHNIHAGVRQTVVRCRALRVATSRKGRYASPN